MVVVILFIVIIPFSITIVIFFIIIFIIGIVWCRYGLSLVWCGGLGLWRRGAGLIEYKGSWGYRAPEMANLKRYSTPVDVLSLGVLSGELLQEDSRPHSVHQQKIATPHICAQMQVVHKCRTIQHNTAQSHRHSAIPPHTTTIWRNATQTKTQCNARGRHFLRGLVM